MQGQPNAGGADQDALGGPKRFSPEPQDEPAAKRTSRAEPLQNQRHPNSG